MKSTHPLDHKRGEMVRAWPTHARVPVNANGGAWLPLTGKTVAWSTWWAQRLRDGDVTLIDPNPQPAEPAMNAREVVAPTTSKDA